MSKSAVPDNTDEKVVVARYDITKVPAHQYHYKTFRYSKLSDALAQAQRELSDKD